VAVDEEAVEEEVEDVEVVVEALELNQEPTADQIAQREIMPKFKLSTKTAVWPQLNQRTADLVAIEIVTKTKIQITRIDQQKKKKGLKVTPMKFKNSTRKFKSLMLLQKSRNKQFSLEL
jgi:hypothetical protein